MSHRVEGILSRVRKYQLPVWEYEALPLLNPYSLASMGYEPTAPQTLQCHLCHKQVLIPEEPQNEVLLLELQQHEENCLYLNQPSYRLSREDLYLSMEEIYAELNEKAGSEQYPLLNSQAILNYTTVHGFMLRKTMALYKIDPIRYNISFFLRLFGWYFTNSPQEDQNPAQEQCLTCYFCGQTLALSQFKTTPSNIQDPELEATTEAALLLDPTQEHRYFCMWTGAEENWVVLLQDLEDKYLEYASFKLKVQPLSMKKMKVHIEKYLQSFSEKIQASFTQMEKVAEEFDRLTDHLAQQPHGQPSEQRM